MSTEATIASFTDDVRQAIIERLSLLPPGFGAKDNPLPFLLASTRLLVPFVPGCTRIATWSPSTTYSSLSPGLIRNALRIFPRNGRLSACLITLRMQHRSVLYM